MTSKSSLVLMLAAGLLFPALGCDKQETGEALPEASGDKAPPRAEVPTLAAGSGSGAVQTSSHRWVGSVRAKHHVELAPGMTGVLSKITVEEGDTVEEGQLLFKVEGSTVRLAVAQAQAAVAQAQLALGEAERETERTRKLAARGSVGSASLERAESGVAAAKAAVKQAKAAAAIARSRTGDLSVESPISGVVVAKHKSVGELATMMPPTIVLVVDDLSTVEVRVRVPELKLREIDVGSSVAVYFPALDLEREVTITRIGNAVDARSRTIEIILEVDNADLRIKSGMSVEVGLVRKAEAPKAGAGTDAGTDADADEPKTAPADGQAAPDGGVAPDDAATPAATAPAAAGKHSAP